MKVCVYAIARDEEKHVRRWLASVKEADGIYVLDTGSRDATAELLRAGGAQVLVEEIVPWRFDRARNRAMELLPEDTDICVSVDMDEIFHPGWRKALEEAWVPGTKQAYYRYTWNFQPDGSEGCVFYREQIHTRRGFRWKNAVHEVLEYRGEEPYLAVRVPGVQLDHHADESKSRAQYLPLLELAVAEEPENDRNMHYLGREYMFRGRWDEAISVFRRHLALPTARWRDERCASMRFMARCLEAKGEEQEAFCWLMRAAGEAPWLREPWVDLAKWMYRRRDWEGVGFAARRALALTRRGESYICEAEAWGALPWDLGALSCYYTGRFREAEVMAARALSLQPGDPRLEENLRLIRLRLREEV